MRKEEALTMLNDAKELVTKQFYSEAINLLEQALAMDPLLYEAHGVKARVLLKQGHIEAAIESHGKLLKLVPGEQRNNSIKGFAGLLYKAKAYEAAYKAYSPFLASPNAEEIFNAFKIAIAAKHLQKVKELLVNPLFSAELYLRFVEDNSIDKAHKDYMYANKHELIGQIIAASAEQEENVRAMVQGLEQFNCCRELDEMLQLWNEASTKSESTASVEDAFKSVDKLENISKKLPRLIDEIEDQKAFISFIGQTKSLFLPESQLKKLNFEGSSTIYKEISNKVSLQELVSFKFELHKLFKKTLNDVSRRISSAKQFLPEPIKKSNNDFLVLFTSFVDGLEQKNYETNENQAEILTKIDSELATIEQQNLDELSLKLNDSLQKKDGNTSENIISTIRQLYPSHNLSEEKKQLGKLKKKQNKKLVVIIGVIVTITLGAVFAQQVIIPTIQDNQAWEAACAKGSPEAYQAYIDQNEGGGHVEDAKNKKEDLLWEQAKKKNTFSAYDAFLAIYGNGRYVVEAKQLRSNALWESTTTENTYESYSYYLERLPNGAHAKLAKLAQDSSLWSNTQTKNSYEAYTEYLNKLPQGSHRTEATAEKDKLLWKETSAENTYQAYDNYLSIEPEGEFTEVAKEKHHKLVWEKAKKGYYDLYLKLYPKGKHAKEALKKGMGRWLAGRWEARFWHYPENRGRRKRILTNIFFEFYADGRGRMRKERKTTVIDVNWYALSENLIKIGNTAIAIEESGPNYMIAYIDRYDNLHHSRTAQDVKRTRAIYKKVPLRKVRSW